MTEDRANGIFITGTDTGVGKTRAAAEMIAGLRRYGMSVLPMKPVASGCTNTANGLRNADALALIEAAGEDAAYDQVNPYALEPPVAPLIAANMAGVCISEAVILQHYAALAKDCDVMVVEGAGGWRMDLAPDLQMADLVRKLGLQVIMVVGMRLGCINHARLTAEAICHDGCRFAGWIANFLDPGYASPEASLTLLQQSLDMPPLMHIPCGKGNTEAQHTEADWAAILALLQRCN